MEEREYNKYFDSITDSVMLLNMGGYNRALSLINKIIKKLVNHNKNQKTKEKDYLLLSYAYNAKGVIYFTGDKFKEADQCFDFSQELFERHEPSKNDLEYVSYWLHYALCFYYKGAIKEMEGEIPEAFEYFKKEERIMGEVRSQFPLDREVNRWYLDCLGYLLGFCWMGHFFEEYLEYAAKYLEVYKSEVDLKEKDVDPLMVYPQMAEYCIKLGRLEEAKSLINEGTALLREEYPENSPEFYLAAATSYKDLGLIEQKLGNYRKAKKLYNKAQKVLGKAKRNLDNVLRNTYELLKYQIPLHRAEIEGLMGDLKSEKKILENISGETTDYLISLGNNPLYSEAIYSAFFKSLQLIVELELKLKNFAEAFMALEAYKERLTFVSETMVISPIAFKNHERELMKLMLDFTLSLSEHIEEEYSEDEPLEKELFEHLKFSLLTLRSINRNNPGILDQEKLRRLEKYYDQLKNRV